MGTTHAELFAALAAPFTGQEVRQRKGSGGQMLSYVTARVIQNRLDSVIGPENWRSEFFETKDGMKCRLSLRINNEWIAKEDGGGFAGMAAEDDNEKSAYSDSFKRAAVQWSISRYLYREGVPSYAAASAPADNGADQPARAGSPAPPADDPADVPRSGRALYAWVRKVEERDNVALVKYLNGWGKLREYPDRMVDWDEVQVAEGHNEGRRKIAQIRTPAAETPAPTGPAGQVHALKKIVRNIARGEQGRQDVTAEECIRALVRLDALVPESLRIADLNTCTDAARLSAYLDAAMKRHDALLAASGTGDAA